MVIMPGAPNGRYRSASGGESGGTIPSDRALGQRSRLYQLAEWFGLCDLVAERDGKLFGKKFAKPPKLWAYLHRISKNHTTMQSDHLQLITATVLSIGGLILLFCGIFIDPQGQIHETLLVAFGETATFAGALFGIDYVYKKRP